MPTRHLIQFLVTFNPAMFIVVIRSVHTGSINHSYLSGKSQYLMLIMGIQATTVG